MRPFAANPELQVHMRRELEESIQPENANTAAWTSVAAQLEKQDRSRWAKYWRWALLALAALVALICLLPSIHHLLRSLDTLNGLIDEPFPWPKIPSKPSEWPPKHLSPQQRLILVGDTSKSKRSEQLAALCRQFPDNPAYYIDYAIAYASDYKALPPDFLETAERIDPDNGWFPIFAASLSYPAITPVSPQTKKKGGSIPKRWDITDQASFEKGIQLFQKGIRMPRFDSYQRKRIEEQVQLLPEATDFPGAVIRMGFIGRRTVNPLAWLKMSELIVVRANLLADQGKSEAFEKLLCDYTTFLNYQLNDESSFLEVLITRSSIHRALTNLIDDASRLELEQDATRLKAIKSELDAEKAARDERSTNQSDLIPRHGNPLTDLALPLLEKQVSHAPEITKETLEPSRRIFHAFYFQIFTTIFAVILIPVVAISALYRFRHDAIKGKIATRLTQTFTARDWGWILGVGSIAPLLYFEAIYHLTPLGGRDWNYAWGESRTPVAQQIGLLSLVLLTPLVITRWHMPKSYDGLLNLKPSKFRIERILLLLAAISIPLAGLDYGRENSPVALAFTNLLLIIVLLGILAFICAALFGKPSKGLMRQSTARALVPAYLMSFCVMATMSSLFRIEEGYWASKDTLMSITAEKPALSSYEYDVTQIMKADLIKTLAPILERSQTR